MILTAEWETEQTGPTVSTIRVKCREHQEWEQWVLLSAVRHLDNPKTDLNMQRRHLDQAKERNACVIDIGDLFDAMQGKGDRRSMKQDLKDEHKRNDYLGSLIREGTQFFEPYAAQLALIGTGNHESGVLKNHELDLTGQLVDRLKDKGSPVILGGYRGWIRFLFNASGKSHFRQAFKLHYNHGSGGGGPVTKGVIGTNRRATYLPDADIVVGGHIHEAWMVEQRRARLNDLGAEYSDEQVHICLPTYKDEFFGTSSGYHHENERPPKPLGAWWLRFFYDWRAKKIKFETQRAK